MKISNTPWKQILSRHLHEGPDGINRFGYRNADAADRKQLKDYLLALQQADVSSLSRDEQMAFWINLYNAATIDVVLNRYPVKSIREISLGGALLAIGPWKKKFLSVEGRSLSLDNIEHDILRPGWKDPRIHYAVNCASVGCPNLMAKPFEAKHLDEMLDEGAVAYVNHPRGVSFRRERLVLSQIYAWYRTDFGRTDTEVIAHLSRYAAPALKSRLASIRSIADYAYDWSLNDAG